MDVTARLYTSAPKINIYFQYFHRTWANHVHADFLIAMSGNFNSGALCKKKKAFLAS